MGTRSDSGISNLAERKFIRFDSLAYVLLVLVGSQLLVSNKGESGYLFPVIAISLPIIANLGAWVVGMRKVVTSFSNLIFPVSRPLPQKSDSIQSRHLDALRRHVPRNIPELIRRYEEKGLDKVPDSYLLVRILGNDLPPRHALGQTLENLRFVLENEPDLDSCEKHWIVNRIADRDAERAVIELLEQHKQGFTVIPFILSEFSAISLNLESLPARDFLYSGEYEELGPERKMRLMYALNRDRINYAINNNGARNLAIDLGQGKAKWVLPWDGNCFLTEKAWGEIRSDIEGNAFTPYLIIPMSRASDYMALEDSGSPLNPVEEPQVIFRSDAKLRFNEAFCYGRRPKVELFWRLGVPGRWDNWFDDSWDLPRPSIAEEAGQWMASRSGWVWRLPSGQSRLESPDLHVIKQRGESRHQGVMEHLDRISAVRQKGSSTLASGTEEGDFWVDLLRESEKMLTLEPPSVVHKSEVAPSGDKHDYYHPAPYWWPNPNRASGLPYVRRDGERIPGTLLFSEQSKKYDRSALQLMFETTTTLALAAQHSGRKEFGVKAAEIIRVWFIEPETYMNPNLNYAQVRLGHNNNLGFSTGLIELGDLYFFLRAVGILEDLQYLSHENSEGLRLWLKEYLIWISASPQGQKEARANNNHGTWYEIQRFSIELYLGMRSELRLTTARALSRIQDQFTIDGQQPHETGRKNSLNYYFYNLQAWFNLLDMISRVYLTSFDFEKEPFSRIRAGYLFIKMNQENWPYEQEEAFKVERNIPLDFFALRLGVADLDDSRKMNVEYSKYKYCAHDGVPIHFNVS